MPAGDEDTQLLKEKLVTAVTQAFASLENAETEAEHGTRVILSDTAEGLKKTLHTVRKVATYSLFYPWTFRRSKLYSLMLFRCMKSIHKLCMYPLGPGLCAYGSDESAHLVFTATLW